jgi:hypothetical protein
VTRNAIRSYPFLLAIVPALHIVAANPGQSNLDDLAIVVCVILLACAAIYAVTALAARGRWAGWLPPLAVFAVVLWFWGYVPLVDAVGRRGDLTTHLVLLPLVIGVTIGAGWWLLRHSAVLDRMATFLTMVGGLLVGWSALSIGRTTWRDARVLHRSELVRRLAQPIPTRAGTHAGPQRDIYLIILDEYANAEATSGRYGFDNREFLDSLGRLGFTVPVVHSNYMHTVLSVPSLLNASHLLDMGREVPGRTSDPTVPNYLAENSRVVSFLRSHGYRFAFFPSFWWPATRHNRHADVDGGDSPSRPDLIRSLGHTELRRDLRMMSVLDLLHRETKWHAADADHITRTFAGLARVPAIPGPVFAFAHVISPHKPFTFDEHCRTLGKAAERRVGGGYVRQVECLDRMVLRLVTTLLRESDVPPVILLQGDHGTSAPAFDSAATVDEIPAAAARERFAAFGAYYLPGAGHDAMGDSVTVVNVLGDVLRAYFGADLPPQSDAMFLSTYPAPYVFRRANPAWLAGARIRPVTESRAEAGSGP